MAKASLRMRSSDYFLFSLQSFGLICELSKRFSQNVSNTSMICHDKTLLLPIL